MTGIALALGVWGAVLSTILAAIRILEWRRSNVKIQVSRIWRSDSGQGNDVLIMNCSTTPVCVYNYDVVSAKRKNDGKSINYLVDVPVGFQLFTIPPLSSYAIHFSDADHFDIAAQQGTVFIRLWIVGQKRPLWFDLS
jgi:hypothetical protein